MPLKREPVDIIQPRRRRGRQKPEDLVELQERLIAVGRELFFKHGYGGMTMSDLVAAARVSKTSLYARFPSKAALFRAIVGEQVERWGTGLRHTPLDHLETLEEYLLGYGDLALRAGMEPEFMQLNRLIYGESGRFPELAEIARGRFAIGAKDIADRIRHFAERDGVPCNDPLSAAEHFLFTLAGRASDAVLANQLPATGELDAGLRRTVQIFLAARSAW